MALVVPREVAARFLDAQSAMEALRVAMADEASGDTFHMPPFGGSKSERRTIRTVGGGLYGLGRMGVRAGATQLFDTETGELIAIVGGTGNLRVGATVGLAAQCLARPDAHSVGLLGTGRNALPVLECLKLVRPIERVDLYSPTPEHRQRFAERATAALGITVTAHDTPAAAITDADIVAVGTSSYSPVLSYDDARPGTHITSWGMSTELDESVYLRVDQFVAPSRDQEVEAASPVSHPHVEGHLYRLVQDGRYGPAAIVELGAIMSGDVAARNGPTDISLFRDSRGGVGDVAMANWVYERAREAGLGVEVDL